MFTLPSQALDPAVVGQGICTRLASDEALVEQGMLQPDCAATFIMPQPASHTRGVVLMLHGFTAGPWQYREMANHLVSKGFACYAARLPGHGAAVRIGLASELNEDGTQLPTSSQAALFSDCANQALSDARKCAHGLQVPLYAVGASAGGAMILDLLRDSGCGIERAVLVAPLVRPAGLVRRGFFGLMRWLPWGGRLTDRIAFAWRKSLPRPDGWLRPGHSRFHLGNVHALFAYVSRTKLKGLQVPCQFICTATDDKIDVEACRALVQKSAGRHFLWCFPASWHVPHAMMTRWENPHETSRTKLFALTERFFCSGEGESYPTSKHEKTSSRFAIKIPSK